MLDWIKNIFKTQPSQNQKGWGYALRERDPNRPINFGHKWIWAAVKTEDTESLLTILNLKGMEKMD